MLVNIKEIHRRLTSIDDERREELAIQARYVTLLKKAELRLRIQRDKEILQKKINRIVREDAISFIEAGMKAYFGESIKHLAQNKPSLLNMVKMDEMPRRYTFLPPPVVESGSKIGDEL